MSGWTEFQGIDCPIEPYMRVEVRLRIAPETPRTRWAGRVAWDQVVAYCVLPERPANVTHGRVKKPRKVRPQAKGYHWNAPRGAFYAALGCSKQGTRRFLGRFATEIEAAEAVRKAREAV
jgi:hypothetical protein